MQSCKKLALPCLVFFLTTSLMASPGEVVHTFQGGSNGQNPIVAPIMDSAGNLFGTARAGLSRTVPVYELSPSNGSWNYQVIYQFPGAESASQLLLDGSGNLYGTTYAGGTNGLGTVFELTKNESTWTATTLYNFGGSPTDGNTPFAGLIFDSAGNLYGTTENGGSFGKGTVFELSPDGSGGWAESLLYQFQGKPDGATPLAGVTFDKSGNLFGTTIAGGNSDYSYCYTDFPGCGTLYELTPGAGGWTETIVHYFGATMQDGRWANSQVTINSSGNLFATTLGGGGSGCSVSCGAAYEFSPGQGGVWAEHWLATFDGQNGLGFSPSGGLFFAAGGNLYGATAEGGTNDCGTIYIIRRNSKPRAKTLYNFTGGADGCNPNALFLDSTGTTLYGTANDGGNANGNNGDGTVFTGHISGN